MSGPDTDGQVVVLTGGVGGAKLVLGLARVLPPETITAIVNTGDDFRHFGLAISPDIDTLLYTLSGKANQAQGWGRQDESWGFMAAMRSLGGADWFNLGDADLALHVLRSARLAEGVSLSQIITDFAQSWRIASKILPMSDDKVATIVETDAGDLSFQDYFVARRCQPMVRGVRFAGAEQARPAAGVIEAITAPGVRAILIAPSNPWLSVDPILAVPGIAEALQTATAPVVAVSPIVGGKAVKGPTDKLMRELGIAVTPEAIAHHYREVIDALLIDNRDSAAGVTIPHDLADTLMLSPEDRERVALAALALADRLR